MMVSYLVQQMEGTLFCRSFFTFILKLTHKEAAHA
ncbi:MAG: hypothetical protein KatS3mg082_0361 [Nitrospiraceae bacterium]|nr:MAG: hypothetical protein KatS3mg082_0361 [Nitrospiraceae bacterium]